MFQVVLSSNESKMKNNTSKGTRYGKDKDQSKYRLDEVSHIYTLQTSHSNKDVECSNFFKCVCDKDLC